MEFEEFANLIFNEIKPKLENSRGLSIFAKERAKFEGWLKLKNGRFNYKELPNCQER